jgi:hypothetical protein
MAPKERPKDVRANSDELRAARRGPSNSTERKGRAEIHPQLHGEMGNRVCNKMAVWRWIVLARCGEGNPKGAPRTARPRNDCIVDAIHRSMDDDLYFS